MTGFPAEEFAIGVTLDALFRRHVAERPTSTALLDPVDRAEFTFGEPLRFTYAEAEAAVSGLAQRLCALGLPRGSVIAIQLPNIVEAPISLLAVLRAGLIAAPVPLLWRRSDLVAALARVEARGIITLSDFGGENLAANACEAAADLFHLSFPCAFGPDPPDGVMPLDLSGSGANARSEASSSGAVAIVTFDAAPRGVFPVARTHAQWLAAGLAVLLEARIDAGDTIATTLPPASLAGVAAGFVPWLLAGGTLELIHAGARSHRGAARTHLVAPASALPLLPRAPCASCIAIHRGRASATADDFRCETWVDLHAFGEIGVVALRREQRDRLRLVPHGLVPAPSDNGSAPIVIETRIDAHGFMSLRGAMVPTAHFPPEHERIEPRLMTELGNFVPTFHRCRDERGRGLVVEAGPAGVAAIGGLRYGLDDLNARIARDLKNAPAEAVADPLLGERLRIVVDDQAVAAAALQTSGHSPIVVDAVSARIAHRRTG